MRGNSNSNYVKFGPTEMVVQFATDRGELRTNENGEFFLRGFADGKRFTCASPDLERRLADLDYRAGDKVGISRQTRNRSVVWKVRLIEESPNASQPRPAPPPTPRRMPPPIPEAKYAPPPIAWPEAEAPPRHKPNGVATAPTQQPPQTAASAPYPSVERVCTTMEQCLFSAVDMLAKSQKRAHEQGFNLIFAGSDVQDLASTIYIQLGKESNISLMNRNERLRANGGADPWRH